MRAVHVCSVVLALGLTAACAERNGEGGGVARTADNKICTPFPAQTAASNDPLAVTANPGGDAAAFDDCLHRWGYRLAKADEDDADLVANAVVAACSPVLSRWNQTSLAQPQTGPDNAVSLVTGRINNTPADRYEMGQSKALFYVIQARAGNCAAP